MSYLEELKCLQLCKFDLSGEFIEKQEYNLSQSAIASCNIHGNLLISNKTGFALVSVAEIEDIALAKFGATVKGSLPVKAQIDVSKSKSFPVDKMSVSHDGLFLAISFGGTVEIYSLADVGQSGPVPPIVSHSLGTEVADEYINSLSWSKREATPLNLLVVSSNGTVVLLDLHGEVLGQTSGYTAGDWHPSEDLLILGSENGELFVTDLSFEDQAAAPSEFDNFTIHHIHWVRPSWIFVGYSGHITHDYIPDELVYEVHFCAWKYDKDQKDLIYDDTQNFGQDIHYPGDEKENQKHIIYSHFFDAWNVLLVATNMGDSMKLIKHMDNDTWDLVELDELFLVRCPDTEEGEMTKFKGLSLCLNGSKEYPNKKNPAKPWVASPLIFAATSGGLLTVYSCQNVKQPGQGVVPAKPLPPPGAMEAKKPAPAALTTPAKPVAAPASGAAAAAKLPSPFGSGVDLSPGKDSKADSSSGSSAAWSFTGSKTTFDFGGAAKSGTGLNFGGAAKSGTGLNFGSFAVSASSNSTEEAVENKTAPTMEGVNLGFKAPAPGSGFSFTSPASKTNDQAKAKPLGNDAAFPPMSVAAPKPFTAPGASTVKQDAKAATGNSSAAFPPMSAVAPKPFGAVQPAVVKPAGTPTAQPPVAKPAADKTSGLTAKPFGFGSPQPTSALSKPTGGSAAFPPMSATAPKPFGAPAGATATATTKKPESKPFAAGYPPMSATAPKPFAAPATKSPGAGAAKPTVGGTASAAYPPMSAVAPKPFGGTSAKPVTAKSAGNAAAFPPMSATALKPFAAAATTAKPTGSAAAFPPMSATAPKPFGAAATTAKPTGNAAAFPPMSATAPKPFGAAVSTAKPAGSTSAYPPMSATAPKPFSPASAVQPKQASKPAASASKNASAFPPMSSVAPTPFGASPAAKPGISGSSAYPPMSAAAPKPFSPPAAPKPPQAAASSGAAYPPMSATAPKPFGAGSVSVQAKPAKPVANAAFPPMSATAPKPFGAPTSQEKSAFPPMAAAAPKPFGDSSSSLEKTKASPALFGFGSGVGASSSASKSSFKFTISPAAKDQGSESAAKPAFNFGATAAPNQASAPEKTVSQKPAFFPGSATKTLAAPSGDQSSAKSTSQKPTFSFNATATAKPAASKPDQSSVKTASQKPSFSFNATTTAKLPTSQPVGGPKPKPGLFQPPAPAKKISPEKTNALPAQQKTAGHSAVAPSAVKQPAASQPEQKSGSVNRMPKPGATPTKSLGQAISIPQAPRLTDKEKEFKTSNQYASQTWDSIIYFTELLRDVHATRQVLLSEEVWGDFEQGLEHFTQALDKATQAQKDLAKHVSELEKNCSMRLAHQEDVSRQCQESARMLKALDKTSDYTRLLETQELDAASIMQRQKILKQCKEVMAHLQKVQDDLALRKTLLQKQAPNLSYLKYGKYNVNVKQKVPPAIALVTTIKQTYERALRQQGEISALHTRLHNMTVGGAEHLNSGNRQNTPGLFSPRKLERTPSRSARKPPTALLQKLANKSAPRVSTQTVLAPPASSLSKDNLTPGKSSVPKAPSFLMTAPDAGAPTSPILEPPMTPPSRAQSLDLGMFSGFSNLTKKSPGLSLLRRATEQPSNAKPSIPTTGLLPGKGAGFGLSSSPPPAPVGLSKQPSSLFASPPAAPKSEKTPDPKAASSVLSKLSVKKPATKQQAAQPSGTPAATKPADQTSGTAVAAAFPPMSAKAPAPFGAGAKAITPKPVSAVAPASSKGSSEAPAAKPATFSFASPATPPAAAKPDKPVFSFKPAATADSKDKSPEKKDDKPANLFSFKSPAAAADDKKPDGNAASTQKAESKSPFSFGGSFLSSTAEADKKTTPSTPAPAATLTKSWKDQVTEFYQKYNPGKLGTVDATLAKYAGREAELLSKLRKKYNVPDPTPTPNASASKSVAQMTPFGAGASMFKTTPTPATSSGGSIFGGSTNTAQAASKPVASMTPFGSPPTASTSFGTPTKPSPFGASSAPFGSPLTSNNTPFGSASTPAATPFGSGTSTFGSGFGQTSSLGAGNSGGGFGTSNPHRQRLIEFYQKHNPAKVSEVDKTLQKFAGREEEMFQKLHQKYKVAPAPAGFGSTTPSFGSPTPFGSGTAAPSFGSPSGLSAGGFGSGSGTTAPSFGSPTQLGGGTGAPAFGQTSTPGGAASGFAGFASGGTTGTGFASFAQSQQKSTFGSPSTLGASSFGSGFGGASFSQMRK